MNATERSAVQFGGTRIDYAIRRSSRRATVAVAVDPNEGVIITAPNRTSVDRLDRLVRVKGSWIVERLRGQSDRPAPLATREFVSGETFLYLGRQYRLRIEVDSVEVGRLALRGGWMHVRVPRGLGDKHAPHYARAALVDWYRRRAIEHVQPAVAEWAARIGVQEPLLLLREQARRWASCDARGTVRVNWRIVQAPRSLVAYVVVHELVHLVHHDHTPAFWARLGRVMPDYEERRERLREIGSRFQW